MIDLLRFSKQILQIRVIKKDKDIVFISDNPKKIKKAYITFLPSELITRTIEVSSKVKDTLVESVIKAKLSKEIKEDFVFIYSLESKQENVNIYKAEIVLKKDIVNIINTIKTKNIEVITTDYHSLFSVSKKYFQNAFISVYLTNESIVYAGGKEKLEFFRSIPTPLSPQEIAEDINRTVIYFKQQSKSNPLNVLLSGNTETINSICEQINAEVSQPLSFVKNLDNRKFNKYFLNFGTLFTKENFIPEEIKNFKTFKKTFLLIATFLLMSACYLGFLSYKKITVLKLNEQKLLQKQKEFENMKNSVTLLDKNTLDYYLKYLTLQKESKKSDFLSQLNKIRPLFKYFLPYSVSVDKNIRVFFEKRYPSFKEMITQKEEIEALLKNLRLNYFIKPNYETKRLELIVILKRLK